MYLFSIKREDILTQLPKNLIGVEIGVAMGDFSHELITKCQPKELHLIDPWEHQSRDDYQEDFNNATENEQELRYQYVCKRFAPFLKNNRLYIHRDYSQNIAEQFENTSLDWVYIDGLHSYDGVMSDLEHYAPKIKDDGIIMGHDYTNNKDAYHMGFGVIEAVNEFIKTHGYHLLMMTWENFPTYVLCKDPSKGLGQFLLYNCLNAYRKAIHLPDYPAGLDFHHHTAQIGDDVFFIPAFRLPKQDEA
jgi:hypothetical protein